MGIFDVFNKSSSKPSSSSSNAMDPRVAELIEKVSKSSPSAKKILDEAIKRGVSFSMESGMSDVGMYDSKRGVLLNENMSDDMLMSTLVHEARHSCQDYYYSSEQTIESAIKVNRATEADAMAWQCAAAYEMRATNPAVFDAFRAKHPEVADAYAAEMTHSKQPDKAVCAAFKSWYKDDAFVAQYDKDVTDYMEKYYNPSRSLLNVPDKDLISDMCPYLKHDKDFLSSKEATTIRHDIYDAARKIETNGSSSHQASVDKMNVKDASGKVSNPSAANLPTLKRMDRQAVLSRLGRLSSR